MTLAEGTKTLIDRIYITKSARFEAYRRMKRRKLGSTVSLALLSISIIGFNTLQLCKEFEGYNEAITAVTIMLSVFVLALSLLVSYLNYSEKEHQYYECAMQLGSLYDRIRLKPEASMTEQTLCDFYINYDNILSACGINHIFIDYKRAMQRMDKLGAHLPTRLRNGEVEGTDDNEKKDDNNKKYDIYWCGFWIPKGLYMFMETTKVWLQWYVFDVYMLYWILAIGIPTLAAYIIFCSPLFHPCGS